MSEKKILFVRSGGGLPGLDIHTGIWLALAEAGITATHCVGTSAGAIISAFDAAGRSSAGIEFLLRSLADSDVRSERFAWKLRIPWIDWFLDSAPVARLLGANLPRHFSDLTKPLEVVATRCLTGEAVWFNSDLAATLRSAVLASMSISGVFPWVTIAGQWYSDGGTRANLPLPSNWQVYDEVWLLIATRPLRYQKKTDAQHGLLTRLMLNLDFFACDQILDVLEPVRGNQRVRVLWPQCGSEHGTLHFDHNLIEVAYQETRQQIKEHAR